MTARTRFADWSLEASIFRADYDGFIAAYATGAEEDGFPVYAYSQDDVVLSGFEGRLEGPLGSVGGWNLEGELTGEYVEASLDAGGDLPRLPPLSVTAGISASRAGHDLHLEAEWADVQDNTTPFEFKSQSYVLVNARWSFEPIERRDLRVILEARNINDAEARLHTSFLKDQVPLPGRNFRAALVLDF